MTKQISLIAIVAIGIGALFLGMFTPAFATVPPNGFPTGGPHCTGDPHQTGTTGDPHTGAGNSGPTGNPHPGQVFPTSNPCPGNQ